MLNADFSAETAPQPLFADVLEELTTLAAEIGLGLADPAAQNRLDEWRIRTAELVIQRLQSSGPRPVLVEVQELLRELRRLGAADFAVPAAQLDLARGYLGRGWLGVVAAMFVAPAWQLDEAPRLRDVQPWLMPIVATYAFSTPQLVTVSGQLEALSNQLSRAVADLATLVEANRGAVAVRSAVQDFQVLDASGWLEIATPHAPGIRAARARVFASLNRGASPDDMAALPRLGRKLKVGVIARTFDLSRPVMSLLPLIERLDATRFELLMFTADGHQTSIDQHLLQRGATPMLLVGEVEEMAQTIREAGLDLAVYVIDGAWSHSAIAQLSLYRNAPLQLVHDGSGLPSFLLKADIFPAADALVNRTERPLRLPVAMLPCTNEIAPENMPDPWSREAMGIDGEGVVFGVVGGLREHTPSAMSGWIRILALVPRSRLVLCVPQPSTQLTDRFCGSLARQLALHSIESSRVSVFSDAAVATEVEKKACIAGIDVLLDFDGGAADLGFAAFGEGIPIVTCAGSANRTATLLRHASVAALVANDLDAAVIRAAELGNDAARLADARELMRNAAATISAGHDSHVCSEAFGTLVETAYDAVVASRRDFQRTSEAFEITFDQDLPALQEETRFFLDLGSGSDAETRARKWLLREPASPQARGALAKALSIQQRHAEASALWLSIVELAPRDAVAWYELAASSRQSYRIPDALRALQVSLQVDPSRVDSWLLLSTLASEAGDEGMRKDIAAIVRELAPTDPQVLALVASVAA